MGKFKTQNCPQSLNIFIYYSDGLISKPELKKLVPSVVKLVGHDDVNSVRLEN